MSAWERETAPLSSVTISVASVRAEHARVMAVPHLAEQLHRDFPLLAQSLDDLALHTWPTLTTKDD